MIVTTAERPCRLCRHPADEWLLKYEAFDLAREGPGRHRFAGTGPFVWTKSADEILANLAHLPLHQDLRISSAAGSQKPGCAPTAGGKA